VFVEKLTHQNTFFPVAGYYAMIMPYATIQPACNTPTGRCRNRGIAVWYKKTIFVIFDYFLAGSCYSRLA